MWYNIVMENKKINKFGFTLVEVMVAAAIFLIFAVGVYSSITLVFKIVYQSRVKILETALLSEELETVRNLPYDSIGILNGIPAGILSHTKTVIRNGTSFDLVTSVRNVDDPFDGMVGGTPNDTAPADYKIVEISAICQNCYQREPVILNTIISPKSLEGASQNGALFIHVFDSNGLSVPDANVHIVNTNVIPNIIIDDVTDNDGMLRVIDAPTGTLSYNITVSKSGYSTDKTISSSDTNPNPLKPPANVVSQAITEISFSIDKVGSLNIFALNPSCNGIAGPTTVINGEKKLGLNPDVYKMYQSFSLSGGNFSLDNLEWDTYYLSVSGTAYDLAGSVPMLSHKLNPGVLQDIFLVLRPHSANSLLVKVKDAGTGLPLSDALVRLTATGYDESFQTSLGYVRQTELSGGSGQVNFLDETTYFSDDGNLVNDSPAGDLKLKKFGNTYTSGGSLESSTFDVGDNITLRNIIFEPISQPIQSGNNSVLFQLAGSNSSTPTSWDFLGPDGTTASYYTATNTVIYTGLNNNRYLRYRVFLSTLDNHYTPQLSEVALTFTNDCTPPGQTFFNSLSAGSYTLDVSRSGYSTNNGQITISGNNEIEVNMSPL